MVSNIKDIGILTMHRVLNYGSVLQAYATQCVVEELGYSCEIIDYVYPNKFQFDRGIPFTTFSIKSRISRFLGLKSYWRKSNKFNSFYKRYLNLSQRYDSPSEIFKNPPIYKCYITGSDQVWNPKFTKGDLTFLLNFAVNEPKISYASSFACDSLPLDLNDDFAKLLNCYSAISVRESNGAKLIQELINRNVPIVLDPTLLLPSREWIDKMNINLRENNKGYILVYILKYATNPSSIIYDVIDKLQDATKLDVIFIGEEGFVANKNKKWKCLKAPNPKQFVQLFAESTYVVTSSFHGTAFGLNFGKPIFSVVDSKSNDDRISTLLKEVGLESSILTINNPLEKLCLDQDIESSQKELNSLRDMSLAFLKQSIFDALNDKNRII